MAALRDVMAYVIQGYPPHMHDELSNARLTKMIYLADWHQALTVDRQITSIQWYFDNYGPYVNDVKDEAESNPRLFSILRETNAYGAPKVRIEISDAAYLPQLSPQEVQSLDHIIAVVSPLYWDAFIKLVYATHPIASSERYTRLDLVQKAREYNRMRAR